MRSIALLFLLAISPGLWAQTGDLYNFDNSRRFADYLYRSGQFSEAALEYQRLFYLQPENDSVQVQLLASFRLSGSYSNSAALYQRIIGQYGSSTALDGEYYKSLIHLKAYDEALSFVQYSDYFSNAEKEKRRLQSLLLAARWDSAIAFSQRVEVDNPTLKGFLTKAESLKYKSPALAASLSTLVPGAGKIYAGRTTDGIMAFIFVAANAFAAYRGFSENGISSGFGWTFATIGTAYYLSNIYGSYSAARSYNRHLNQHLQSEVEAYTYSTF